MKIPKKVKVGGTTYKIKNVDIISAGTGLNGLCDYDNSVIELLKSHKQQAKEEVFLHELIHALFYHCDLKQDEHTVELLAQALYMVIKDNPEVFK